MRFFKNTSDDREHYAPELCSETEIIRLTESLREHSKIKFRSRGNVLFIEAVDVRGETIIGHIDTERA